MRGNIAISVQRVGKVYRIWESPTARLFSPMFDTIGKFTGSHALRHKAASGYRDFRALNNISFEVRKGESVGIIGRNGSGKSSLLQIIAGTLQPTSGSVKVHGRVAAMLELGSGFNPEFTGRENVYLQGAVLGLSRVEVTRRFADILAFADIGAFIDQPVKTYSSGMQLRLAFATQATIEPEILIVDEALSVGDESFQRKCFARIEWLRARGTTLLLVSHDIQTVSRICNRAVHIESGEVVTEGHPAMVGKLYQKMLYAPGVDLPSLRAEFARLAVAISCHDPVAATAQPSGFYDPNLVSQSRLEYTARGARIERLRLLSPEGADVNVLAIGSSYQLTYRVVFATTCQHVMFACAIKTKDGLEISGMHSHAFPESIPLIEAGTVLEVSFLLRCDLNIGLYCLNAGVLARSAEGLDYLHRVVDGLLFRAYADAPVQTTAICRLVHDCKISVISADTK